MKPPLSETRLHAAILRALRAHGGWWVSTPGGPMRSAMLDVVGAYHGIMIALEIKRPKCYPTKRQRLTIRLLESDGEALASVVHSTEEALMILHAIDDFAAHLSDLIPLIRLQIARSRTVHATNTSRAVSRKAPGGQTN